MSLAARWSFGILHAPSSPKPAERRFAGLAMRLIAAQLAWLADREVSLNFAIKFFLSAGGGFTHKIMSRHLAFS
jgi:hypothetical protein